MSGYFIAIKTLYEIAAVCRAEATTIHRFHDEWIGGISVYNNRMAVKTNKNIYLLEANNEEIENAIVCSAIKQLSENASDKPSRIQR